MKKKIELIQTLLKRNNLYHGEIDGLAGTKILQAVAGLAGVEPAWPEKRKIIAAIQIFADREGINVKPIDGFWGPVTEEAFNELSAKVIFTTAQKDYAIEAFESDAIDYLLKQVSFEQFLKAVNKFTRINPVEINHYAKDPGFLYFRADRKMVKVFLEDITYIESYKDYIVIHRTNDADLKVKYAIGSVENMLPRNLFLRIHRSYIVSIKKVTAFTNYDVEIGKTEIPIGKSYPDVFKKLTCDSSVLSSEEQ